MVNAYDVAFLAKTPICYWMCDETAGTTLADATGHGHTLTLSGSYSLNQPGLIFEPSKSVRFTGGLAVSGDGSNAAYDFNNFTLVAWLKHEAHPDGQRILMRDFFGAARPFSMELTYLPGPGTLRIDLYHQTSGGVAQLSGTVLTAATEYMITQTYDGANLKIYVNDTLVATQARVGTTSTSDNNVGMAGATGNGALRYRGYLSRLGMFNYAWTLADVAEMYDLGLNGAPPPETPTGLNITDATVTKATLNWTASVGEVTAYEVRVNGGTPIDVGNVLSYEFTGLTPETLLTFEVRAYNDNGYSAWASTTATLSILYGFTWGDPDDRYFQHGVDRGVLYPSGEDAVVWNGIIGVDEASDSASTLYYIDGRVYLADVDPGDFSGRLSAYFWPAAFDRCIGIPEIADGFHADNQKAKRFSFSYRSLIGSGTTGDMFGYQIHLVYNAMATIGTRSRKTINETPTPMEFNFDLVATPIALPGYRPTAHYIVDTRNLSLASIAQIEEILYGSSIEAPRMPTPLELFDILNFGSAITFVDHGDGTWTGSGSSVNVHMTGEGTWKILNVNGTDNGDGTYLLQDTP